MILRSWLALPRTTLKLVIIGLGVSLLLPGMTLQWFDGIPIVEIPEISALVVLIMSVASRRNRELLIAYLESTSSRIRSAMVIFVGLLIATKMIFFLFFPVQGEYETCLRHLDSAPGEECVPEFASPLSYGVTRRGGEYFGTQSTECPEVNRELSQLTSSRISRTNRNINFGPLFLDAKTLGTSSWDINFINSFRYDRGYWPWEPEDRDIQRVGFEAQWRGDVKIDQSQLVRVSYVGQGMVFFDGKCFELAPRYERENVVELDVGAGAYEIAVVYVFDDRSIGSESSGPYASIRLQLIDGGKSTYLEVSSSVIVRIAAVLWDFALAIVVLLTALLLARRSRSQILRSLAIVVLLGVASWIDLSSGFKLFGLFETTVVILIAILLARTLFSWRLNLPVGLAVVLASWTMLKLEFSAFLGFDIPTSYVPIRLRGNDQLVYHALAQEMLQSGFLRGAEDIFYFQPGIRYVFFTLQIIFGSGIVVYGTLILAAMLYSLIWFSDQLQLANISSRVITSVGITAAVVWWSSSMTVQSMTLGLSEFGTWPILVFVGGFVLRGVRTVPQGICLGLALAAIPWIRPNQGVAALVLVGTFLVSKSIAPKIRLALLAVFSGSLLLVPIHNLTFGREIAFLPRGHLFADQVSWTSILGVFVNESAQVFFVDQIRGFLYLPTILRSIYSPRMGIFFYSVLFLWTCSVILALVQIRRDRRMALMHLLVVAQLVPFLKYSFFRYFPIHLVAIYLAMWMVSLAVLTRSSLFGESRSTNLDECDVEETSRAVR